MSLRTVYKDGRVKTDDEVIDFIERFNGAELMPYQKLFVRALYGVKTNMFITMPKFLGRTQIANIINTCKKWG